MTPAPLTSPPWQGLLKRCQRAWGCGDEWEEPQASVFRARQLQALLRLTPLAMLTNAINGGLVVAAFGVSGWLIPWTALMLLAVLRSLAAWWRQRGRPELASASPRAMRRATLHAGVFGLLWALVPLGLFGGAAPWQQVLVGVVMSSMVCGAIVNMSTVPVAGTLYVVLVAAASAVALACASFPFAPALGALMLCYGAMTLWGLLASARAFSARLHAQAEAERQQQVIGLLLRDFEEHTSDVLWELDAAGRLVRPSPRLAALFGHAPDELERQPVLDLLAAMCATVAPPAAAEADAEATFSADDRPPALQRLRRHLEGGTPFRDLVVPLSQGGRPRWWSLTAKPLLDGAGQRTGWRGVAADVTQRHRADRRLKFLAHFDPLTGLSNRVHFRGELERLLARAQAVDGGFALLCLDLDHFKTVNDTRGHAVGDGLLREVGRRLQAHTRRSDIAARLGGDEFAVILRHVESADEAAALTQRLLDGLQQPCEVQGVSLAVRSSIGVALAPQDGEGIDALLNNADLALYAAKSHGRGRYRFFSPEMGAQTRRRQQLEEGLRSALVQGEMHLLFQPQIGLQHWEVVGFEALLRWVHPQLGEVGAAEFIPVAEEAGLIGEIGAWVLHEACRCALQWPEALGVSVNVSRVQALSHSLCEGVDAVLARTGLAPHRLELELSQAVFFGDRVDAPALLGVLTALRSRGLRIALEDFATARSSLADLRRFPFDTLKIDRVYVRELLSRRDARAIVKMLIGLAGSLHIRTIAAGVEEPAQVDLLTRYGCVAMQGHFGAVPMTAAEIGPFLDGWRTRLRPPRAEPVPSEPMALG